jgi:hypothetical protein
VLSKEIILTDLVSEMVDFTLHVFIFGSQTLIRTANLNFWSWDSSVSTVSDYILDNRGSIPGRGKGFFL